MYTFCSTEYAQAFPALGKFLSEFEVTDKRLHKANPVES
jgi:hypothetical protein